MRKLTYFRSFFLAATLAISSLAFTSCSDDTDAPAGAYTQDGVFVVNEGNFEKTNASISFYDNSSQQATQQVFKAVNDRLLGDVAQSMTIAGNRAFIVVNNSNKIEVVDAGTFESVGVVEGLSAPRYFAALNNEKGYVTEWFPPNPDWSYNKGRVSVIDLKNYTVLKTIEVDVQPEQLLIANGKVYVANAGSTLVSVIDTQNDMVVKTIPVAYGPGSLVLDKNRTLWVLSSGYKHWQAPESEYTAATLTKIDPATSSVTGTFTFPEVTASAGKLVINGSGDKLYFIYKGEVHEQDVSASSLKTNVVIDRSFYGLGVDPETGLIYGADAKNYVSDGTVHVYKPDGTEVTSFQAGIGPNGFVFN